MDIAKKLITVAEFEGFIDAPENADRLFELIDGEIIEKVPTEEHGYLAARLVIRLGFFVEQNKLGRITVEPRHRIPEDDQNSYLPDVAFTREARKLPLVKKGSVPLMPDLAIEIKSPTDSATKLRRKAAYYLENGSQIVWIILPEKRQIEVYTADGDLQILTEDDVLTGGELVPNFALAVTDLFNEA